MVASYIFILYCLFAIAVYIFSIPNIPNLQICTLHKIKFKKLLSNEHKLTFFNEQIR